MVHMPMRIYVSIPLGSIYSIIRSYISDMCESVSIPLGSIYSTIN